MSKFLWQVLLVCLCFGSGHFSGVSAEDPLPPGRAMGPVIQEFGGPPGGPGMGGPRPLFSPVIGALDRNGDGTIDTDELAKASESLKKLDRNGDGRLTPEEYRPPRAGGMPGPGGPEPRDNFFGGPQARPLNFPPPAAKPPALRTATHIPTNAAEFFGLTNIWEFHLIISAEDWEAMTPPETARPGAVPGNPRTEFPYVHASLQFQGQTITNIGLRYKGNSSYRSSLNGYKRPFKLDFNHFEDKQKFLGLVQLNLANNWRDPSQMREALAYHVFRSTRVPCSRTAFIKLYLTIPGKVEAGYLGLYTAVEDIGNSFLKEHFESSKGLLMKPERYRGLSYLGEDWNEYKSRLSPKRDATAKEITRFITFTDLVHNSTDAAFSEKIEQFLNMDEFLRFLAANTVLANLDSILSSGHNFYLYLRPATNQFVFIPWDLNESFGVFQNEQGDLASLSIKQPYAAPNALIERIMGVPEYERRYRKYLAELIAGPLSAASIDKQITGIELACKEALEMERRSGGGAPQPLGAFGGPRANIASNLRDFCARRVASISAQLAGDAEGLVPEMRRGPGPMPALQVPGQRPARNNPRPR